MKHDKGIITIVKDMSAIVNTIDTIKSSCNNKA